MFDSITDLDITQSSVNHPLLTAAEGTCTRVRRLMDETEVNDS